MQRVFSFRTFFVAAAILALMTLPGCGGGGTTANTAVTSIRLAPTTFSLNQGGVGQLSAVALNSAGSIVPADITFTSSNTAIATISTGGLICGGVWDSSIINCNATQGQAGVGKVTITATATQFNVTATATVYVHERVDQVQAVITGACTSMGQPVSLSGKAFSTSAPGCSPASPCDITSTVGPFSFGTNNATIAASSSGIVSTFSSTSNTPVYLSGGTITGAKGDTCNLTNFNGVVGATATVALTNKDTIDSGTQLTITAPGYGATVAPTSATLSDGTATCSGTASVQTAITSGAMTAQQPGATTLFASVSGVNSPGAPYISCPVTSILVHQTGGSGTSFSLTVPNTQTVTADVIDSAGKSIAPNLTWGSSSNAVATAAAAAGTSNTATVTAVGGGTANITATCSYPTCNIGLSAEYSQNVVTASVSPSASATVYAASTNSKQLVPISTNGNTVGTAVTLPNTPNSIIADPAGKAVYLGSSSGLMAIATGATTVATSPVSGTILAISPDGGFLLVSDSVHNAVNYFSVSTGKLLQNKAGVTANSSAYTPDSHLNEWVNDTILAFGYPNAFLYSQTPDKAPSFLDFSATGALSYVTSATGAQVSLYSTCDSTVAQTLGATAPTLIKGIPNGTGAVAVDPPSLDVIATPTPLNAGCPITTQSTLTVHDLGVGSFTPAQLLISQDSSTAWILPSDLTSVVNFNLSNSTPTAVALAGGAMPLAAGLTANGTQLWVGATDNKLHVIFTDGLNDGVQVSPNLKDSGGNATAPNLVTVLP
jgi:hypothetical protein